MKSYHFDLIQPKEAISTPLHNACLNGDFAKVLQLKNDDEKLFSDMLVKPDHNSSLPLDRAAARGHKEIVGFLCEQHKLTGCNYVMHDKHNYSPLLSAVRWYCKVMDNTYNRDKVIGKFNTGINYKNDFMDIIINLINYFPEQINISDDKGCNAVYYVIHHLADAVNSKHENNTRSLVNLLKLLLQNGGNLDSVPKVGSSARNVAKMREISYLVHHIEHNVNIVEENMSNFDDSFSQTQKIKQNQSTLKQNNKKQKIKQSNDEINKISRCDYQYEVADFKTDIEENVNNSISDVKDQRLMRGIHNKNNRPKKRNQPKAVNKNKSKISSTQKSISAVKQEDNNIFNSIVPEQIVVAAPSQTSSWCNMFTKAAVIGAGAVVAYNIYTYAI